MDISGMFSFQKIGLLLVLLCGTWLDSCALPSASSAGDKHESISSGDWHNKLHRDVFQSVPEGDRDHSLSTSMFLLEKAGRREGISRDALVKELLEPTASLRGSFSDVVAQSYDNLAHVDGRVSLSSSFMAALQEEKTAGPEPQPFAKMPQLALRTLEGSEVLLGGVGGPDYIVSVYYDEPRYKYLWEEANLEQLFSGLPDTAHVVFGVPKGTSDLVMTNMNARCEATHSYSSVMARVHFLAEPLLLECEAHVFPRCPLFSQGWLAQTLSSWGVISPKLSVDFGGRSGGRSQGDKIESVGDDGWLKPISTVVKENKGPLALELATWGVAGSVGEACHADEHRSDDLQGKAVLVKRGTCPFFVKVKNCVAKGASAVIVQDLETSTTLHKMGCAAPYACGDANFGIAAALVSHQSGSSMSLAVGNGSKVTITLGTELQGEHLIGLDNQGRLREIGRVPPTGVDKVHSWAFIALELKYYDYQRLVELELYDDDTHILPVFDGSETVLGGGSGVESTVQMPSWREMSGVDAMRVYMKLECEGAGDKTCGAWDYVVKLHHRSDDAQVHSSVEIGRWVTPYGRPGEWLTDASAFLPLLKTGTKHTFVLSQPEWSVQRYKATVKLLLSASGEEIVPHESAFLFSGGAFDGRYNDIHEPVRVEIPHDAKKVQLWSVISGHGWGTDSKNCAEFCVTEHAFTVRPATEVDGMLYVSPSVDKVSRNLEGAGSRLGCSQEVSQGVVPNQFGTWQFGRAGWCPGGAVKPWVVDITKGVKPGLEALVTYKGLYNGSDFIPAPCWGGDCNSNGVPPVIEMQSYIVIYKKQGIPPQSALAGRSDAEHPGPIEMLQRSEGKMQLQSDSRLGLTDGASSSNVSWAGGFVIFGVLIAGAMGGLYRRGRGGYAAIGAA